MVWYNIFRKKEKVMEEENQYDVPKTVEIEEDWTGVGANDRGGLGIRDYEAYSNRPDVQKTDNEIEELAVWLGIKNPDSSNE